MPESVVIEFIANMEGLTSGLDDVKKGTDAITVGIGKQTASVAALQKAEADLIAIQKTSTQPAILKQVGQELEKVRAEMKAAGQSAEGLADSFKNVNQNIKFNDAKKTIDDFGKSVNETVTKSQRLTTQIRDLKNQLSILEQQGKQNTKQYLDLAVAAGKLEDQVGDTAARVRVLASDTKNLDAALSVATGIAGAFSVAQGAAALFGSENENLQKALLKVQAALAIVNGLQAVSTTLQKQNAAAVVIGKFATEQFAITQQYLATAFKISAAAARAWTIVIAATGIGLLIVGLGFLIAKLSETKDKTDDLTESNEKLRRSFGQTADEAEHAFDLVDEQYKAAKRSVFDLIEKFNERIKQDEKLIALARIHRDDAITISKLEIKLVSDQIAAYESLKAKVGDLNESDLKSFTDLVNKKEILLAQLAQQQKDLAFEANKEEITPLTTGGATAIPVEEMPEAIAATELADFIIKEQKRINAEKKRLREEAAGDVKFNLEDGLAFSQEFSSRLFAFDQALRNRDLKDLQEKRNKGLITEQQYERQVAKLKEKQAKADKTAAVFNAIIATALSILQSSKVGYPAAIPFVIAAAALGAVQLAAIIAQPIPKFAKGTELVKGGKPGLDSVHAMLMPGERVVPTEINNQLLGIPNERLPELAKLSTLMDVSLPYISDDTMSRLETGRAVTAERIDYDKLADKIGKRMKEAVKDIPVTENNWNESGFHKAIRRGNSRTEYLNKRYTW